MGSVSGLWEGPRGQLASALPGLGSLGLVTRTPACGFSVCLGLPHSMALGAEGELLESKAEALGLSGLALCTLLVEEGTVTFGQGEETQRAEWPRRSAAAHMSWEALV